MSTEVGGQEKFRVLIVEDEIAIQRTLSREITSRTENRAIVDGAYNFGDFLKVLEKYSIAQEKLDLLITDFNLGDGFTGFDVLNTVELIQGKEILAVILAEFRERIGRIHKEVCQQTGAIMCSGNAFRNPDGRIRWSGTTKPEIEMATRRHEEIEQRSPALLRAVLSKPWLSGELWTSVSKILGLPEKHQY